MPPRPRVNQRAAAAMRNREQYIRLLHENIPAAAADGITEVGALHGVKRAKLQSAVSHFSHLLPATWQLAAAKALERALKGIVAPDTLRDSDLFMCALIHPTYIPHALGTDASTGASSTASASIVAALRRDVAMPAELMVCGGATLRLMQELGTVQNRAPRPGEEGQAETEEDERCNGKARRSTSSSGSDKAAVLRRMSQLNAPAPRVAILDASALLLLSQRAALEEFILLDRGAFSPGGATAGSGASVPPEVQLAVATALCGATELTSGALAVAKLLDRYAVSSSHMRL